MEATSCPWSDIAVSPARIDFEVIEGWQFIPTRQNLQLTKVSTGRSPNWTAQASEDWVTMKPRSGSVPKTARIGASSVGIPVGVYHAQITITSYSGVTVTSPVVDITLTVKSKEQPEPPEPEPPEPEPPEPEPPEEPEPPPDEPERCWLRRIIEWLLEFLRRGRWGAT